MLTSPLTCQTARWMAHRASRIAASETGYNPASCEADVSSLTKAYPFLEREVVGYSVMGKPIEAIRFGEGERRLHLHAACHANEWITSLLAMTLLEDLACCYADGQPFGWLDPQEVYSWYTLWLVPMVNPDGVELVVDGVTEQHPWRERLLAWNGGSSDFQQWKANIRGVDLNDQYPAFWEEECARRAVPGPGPRDYPGLAPLSEPEAQAMAAWTEHKDFETVLSLHTQGQEIYWNYRGYEPPHAEALARRLAKASGYEAVKLEGSDAGYKDWFIYAFGRPGFTIEAGCGVNPLPLTQLVDMYAEIKSLYIQLLTDLSAQQTDAQSPSSAAGKRRK